MLMSDEELFRTGRMQSLRSMTPAYLPGISVFLQRDVQGFAKGSAARVVSVQSTRPGEFRYQLVVGEQKMWAYESDIRPTAPGDLANAAATADDAPSLGPTQRMRTMTLSQRMASLGPNATQRMHALTQEERLRKMVQTNRLRALGPEAAAAAGFGNTAPGAAAAQPAAPQAATPASAGPSVLPLPGGPGPATEP